MTTQRGKAERFLALHHSDGAFPIPNPYDPGIARLFESMGFEALATTSGGHAATLGRRDGEVTRDEAIAHAAAVVGATNLPVSADFERGFADDPADVAVNVRLAAATGLAGLSIEDGTRRGDDPVFEAGLAAERVMAAADAAHSGDVRLVLTARAENFVLGRRDLKDTIARLQSFQAAGADVLFAPGLNDIDDIRTVVAEVDLPVNVLALPGGPSVSELAAVGVKRVSVGSAFAYVALAAVVAAAEELRDAGTTGFWTAAMPGMAAARAAFTS
ncbi:MAG: isocitrate lyase/PEP mutase family protein [Actinomycetota bacterium]